MDKIIKTPIAGIFLEDLAIIPTTGGAILKMLQPGSPLLPASQEFGELYFSEIAQGVIRAWKRHKKQEQRFAVPVGKVRIGFFDTREASPTNGVSFSLLLGRPDSYRLLKIPKGIWYGFAGADANPSLICNFATLPHDPQEIERAPASGSKAPIAWEGVHLWSPS